MERKEEKERQTYNISSTVSADNRNIIGSRNVEGLEESQKQSAQIQLPRVGNGPIRSCGWGKREPSDPEEREPMVRILKGYIWKADIRYKEGMTS